MKTLLWYQNPNNDGNDFLLLNGEPITPPTNPLYRENFNLLLQLTETNRANTENGTSLFTLKNGFVLKDNFENTDVLGRKMTFLFYSETKNIDEFIGQFNKEKEKLNFHYDSAKVDRVRRLASKFQINKLAIIAIAAVITIILLILLSYGTNK